MPLWDHWTLHEIQQSMGSFLFGLVVILFVSTLAWGLSPGIAKKSPPKSRTTKNQQKSPFERCIDDSQEQGRDVVVLVDSNNVRGKTDFQWTNRDLLKLLRVWKSSQDQSVEVICVVDHGLQAQAFPYEFGLIVLAGPHRTADDVIAAATKWITTPPDEVATSGATCS